MLLLVGEKKLHQFIKGLGDKGYLAQSNIVTCIYSFVAVLLQLHLFKDLRSESVVVISTIEKEHLKGNVK